MILVQIHTYIYKYIHIYVLIHQTDLRVSTNSLARVSCSTAHTEAANEHPPPPLYQHTSAYVSIRLHTSAYEHTEAANEHPPPLLYKLHIYTNIHISIYTNSLARVSCSAAHTEAANEHPPPSISTYVSKRQHTSAYVSIRQHTSTLLHRCIYYVR
jgi:hypothetical protein